MQVTIRTKLLLLVALSIAFGAALSTSTWIDLVAVTPPDVPAAASSAVVLALMAIAIGLLIYWVNYAVQESLNDRDREHLRGEERLRSLIGNAADVILILDAKGTVRYQSPAAELVWGYAAGDLVGLSLHDLHHPDDNAAALELVECALARHGANVMAELRLRRNDGVWRHFEAVANNLLRDPIVQGIVLTCHDVSDRKEFDARLSEMAVHDPLTRLPNRVFFLDSLTRAVARAQRSTDTIAAVCVDLDDFREVNERLGEDAGDRLLGVVAERLRRSVRTGDVVARLTGDTFAILLESVRDEREATALLERIAEVVHAPVRLDTGELQPGVSMGLALCAAGQHGAEALLRYSDLAMYAAKAAGKRRYAVYDPERRTPSGRPFPSCNEVSRAQASRLDASSLALLPE